MSDNGSDIKAIMREFFRNNFLYSSDIDSISDDTSFMNEGIIDSTGVLELLDFIEERFGIDIENGEVIPENLDSFNNIERFLRTKL